MKYILGIDLGTSSLKGSVYSFNGYLISSSSCGYDLIITQKGFSEQDPNDWIYAFINVFEDLKLKIKDFDKKLEAISFSGQMHSLVLLDENNSILRNAILWNDTRTSDQCEFIMDSYGDELIRITKNKAIEGFTLPKILWIKENEPELWNRVRHVLLPKDYLRFFLTGNLNMDYSDAAGTLLLNIYDKERSDEILNKFNIDKSILPSLVESTYYVGDVLPDISDRLGLKNNVKVYAGAADNAASAIGSGIISNYIGLVSIGTSGVVLANKVRLSDVDNGILHTFNHAMHNSYYSMGVTLAAGKSLDWFKKTFANNISFDELLISLETIRPGADGLLFTPYIQGERTPYNDSTIRGSFTGIDISHTFNHFVKSVIEGITFSLKDCLELIDSYSDTNIDTLVSVGGGSKNKLWLQLQSDIFNKNIITLEMENGPSTGAAMIAAVGLGIYDDFVSCSEAFVNYKDNYMPNRHNSDLYNNIYKNYKNIYHRTKHDFIL